MGSGGQRRQRRQIGDDPSNPTPLRIRRDDEWQEETLALLMANFQVRLSARQT
jgi:hypothetical protein